MRKNECKYRVGLMHSQLCDAGVDFKKLAGNPKIGLYLKIPCVGENKLRYLCDKYQEPTDEEIKKYDEVIEKHTNAMIKMIKTKLSSCCNAPFDESRVIKEGEYKNHGSRFCSKCGKNLFHV